MTENKKKASNNLIKDFVFFWVPIFAWGLVIFLFSSQPTIRASEIHWKDFFIKKTAHIIEYAIFSTLFYRAFINSSIEKRKAGFWAIYLSILYGVSDEVHQMFTPGREPTVRDVFFDTIGAVLVIYLIWKWLAKAPKKLRNLAEKLQIS